MDVCVDLYVVAVVDVPVVLDVLAVAVVCLDARRLFLQASVVQAHDSDYD